jgi:hypothetical protein
MTKIENPPKQPMKFGALIVAVVVLIVLGVAGIIAYNYVSENVMERTLGCSVKSGADTTARIPSYAADVKIGMIGKKPTEVSIKYTFTYNNNTEADGVAPETVINMAKDINKDYKIYVDSTTMPVTSGSNIIATVNYSPDGFMKKLLGEDAPLKSSESIIKAASDKLNGSGYTCTSEDK